MKLICRRPLVLLALVVVIAFVAVVGTNHPAKLIAQSKSDAKASGVPETPETPETPPGMKRLVETKTKLVSYKVAKPVCETHEKEITYTVMKPVYETREKTVSYTVCRMVPEVRTKTVSYSTCRIEHETKERTVEYDEVRFVPIDDPQLPE